MPKPARICSLIFPTPGTFLTGRSPINFSIFSTSKPRKVYAFGFLKSEQILASILLQAIPQEAVRPIFSNISRLNYSAK
jgi:hypothetical protein